MYGHNDGMTDMEREMRLAVNEAAIHRLTHKRTNADRIRSMSDEKLADFLMKLMGNVQCFAEGMFPYHPCPQEQNCKQCGIDWLQQPAEDADHA